MLVELIDDFIAAYPTTAGSDKVDTEEADEVIDAITKTVAELTSQRDGAIRRPGHPGRLQCTVPPCHGVTMCRDLTHEVEALSRTESCTTKRPPACPAGGGGRNADAVFICASKRSQTDGP